MMHSMLKTGRIGEIERNMRTRALAQDLANQRFFSHWCFVVVYCVTAPGYEGWLCVFVCPVLFYQDRPAEICLQRILLCCSVYTCVTCDTCCLSVAGDHNSGASEREKECLE